MLKHNYPYKEREVTKNMKILLSTLIALLLLVSVSASHDTYKASSSESHITTKASSWSSGNTNNKQAYAFSSKEAVTRKTNTQQGKKTASNKRTFTFTETSTNTQTADQYGSACQGPYHSARFPRDDPDREHYYNDYYYKPCPQRDGSYSWRY